jgi:hypothetical protein
MGERKMKSMDQWLRCEESGGPFTHCIRCRLPLAEIAEPWLVNKDYHRDECVLEYAICKPCRDATTSMLSEESKEAVRRFLETKIDWNERQREFMLITDETERFDACIACRTLREDSEGFAISALHDSSGEVVTGPLPLLICHVCVAQVTASLSEESRAVWKRFIAEHFAGPPGDFDVSDGFGIF